MNPNLTQRWYQLKHELKLNRPVQISSLGLTGMVILDQLPDEVPVIFIDTLDHFPETYDHFNRVKGYYKTKTFIVFQPLKTKPELDQLFHTEPEAYSWYSKVEPLQRALIELKADSYITGRRADQQYNRTDLPNYILMPDNRYSINLAYDLTFDDITTYLSTHPAIPRNILYSQGYTSVGDIKTTALPTNKHERSGRWVDCNEKECGIHTKRLELAEKFK